MKQRRGKRGEEAKGENGCRKGGRRGEVRERQDDESNIRGKGGGRKEGGGEKYGDGEMKTENPVEGEEKVKRRRRFTG